MSLAAAEDIHGDFAAETFFTALVLTSHPKGFSKSSGEGAINKILLIRVIN